MKKLLLSLASSLIISTACSVQAATFANGDVFVAVASGQVQWRQPNGTLVQTLDTGLGGFTTGMAFDSAGKLYVTGFSVSQVSVFNTDGTLAGTFGSGYSTPESIVFDANGNAYVGNIGAGVLKFDSAGNPLQTFSLGRTDWIDLKCDKCTLLRTTEGNFISAFDVCQSNALPDFVASSSGLLTGGEAFALRVIPTGPFAGQVLLADGVNVKRIAADGSAVVATYDATGQDSWFALNLDPDGTSFWSADFSSANVYRFDLATPGTDVQLSSFNTGTGGGTVFGLVVKGELTCGTFSSDLKLDPAIATNFVGQTHTVTACITSNDVPLPNVTISIDVTGANTASGTCVSDTNGCCTFLYVGINTGDDLISASATVNGQLKKASAAKTWLENPGTCVTRTQGFWFTHPANVDSTCATLLQAIVANGGKLDLGFICLPVKDENGDSVVDAKDALWEAEGLFWKKRNRTGDGLAASSLCKARKALARQLIAALANHALLKADPAVCGLDPNLLTEARQAAACGDVAAIRAIAGQLDTFNNSGDGADFPAGLFPCRANPRGAKTIAVDPTTQAGCDSTAHCATGSACP